MIALKEEKVIGTYNLGSSKGSSVWDVVKAAVSITEFEMEILNGRARKGDPPILLADSTRFREATGWEPIYSLDEIVMTAYKAYKKVK
jgi:UDP-glucose 4-epimerase